MTSKARLFYGILAFFLCALINQPAFSQNNPEPFDDFLNYNGRKMPKRKGGFLILGVKADEAPEQMIALSFYFSDAVDTRTVEARKILVDERPLPPEARILFNKNRNVMQITLRGGKPFEKRFVSVKIDGIKAFDGREMNPFFIEDLEIGSLYKARPEPPKKPWGGKPGEI